MEPAVKIVVAVLAHNEERRIGACLASLPLGDPTVSVHVVVNGSRDRTAAIARERRVIVHDWPEGGKARSWNRFLFDTPGIEGDVFVFVDGDAEVTPGSITALAVTLAADSAINAAAGMPRNGRRAEQYRAEMTASRGLFGDLYALSGTFVAKLRASGVRLPADLIGDDSLIGALAKTDLADEGGWRDARIEPCAGAGFLCEPADLGSPRSLHMQYRRMINYSVRHFQNRIVTAVMRGPGPTALPERMADLYPEWLGRFRPRRHPVWWWFDRQALARMRASAAA
ncbi:glycosyltransferase [Novosphingobium sp. G106]|uniref:glycosyltransferase n=1 Tax=Novosphingobium sp. G106 TaxID=2849500 RepID=UPI001C2DCD49|nr:glycosyltransferase [Novosphingobium sp. G106]MBV1691525.1 glycosyltransferase [Novosphingobium sp. G106]